MPDVDVDGPNELLARTERSRQEALANARQHMDLAEKLEAQAQAAMQALGPRVRYGGGTYQERRLYTRAVATKARMAQVYELAAADVKRLERM